MRKCLLLAFAPATCLLSPSAFAAEPLSTRPPSSEESRMIAATYATFSRLLTEPVAMETAEYVERTRLPMPESASPEEVANATSKSARTYDVATVRTGTWSFHGETYIVSFDERIDREAGDGTTRVTEAFDGEDRTTLAMLELDNGQPTRPTYIVSPAPAARSRDGLLKTDRRLLWFPFLREAVAPSAIADVHAGQANPAMLVWSNRATTEKECRKTVDRQTGQLLQCEIVSAADGEVIQSIRYEYASAENELPLRMYKESGVPGTGGFRSDVVEIGSWSFGKSGSIDSFRAPVPSAIAYDLWDESKGTVTLVAPGDSAIQAPVRDTGH